MTSKEKKYGLIIPKQGKSGHGKLGQSASIFQDDSSDEDEIKKKIAINQELNAVAEKKKQTKQTKEEIERALKEDPNVYKYDEIYEEMEQKKMDVHKDKKETDKKPKYIANLLKSAAMRKREQERRIERSVQKEREKEGDEFADKESFVTAAYRQKMMDQAEEEERLKKQDELDAQHDVMKQKDLSQFYRNLLNRNVAMGATADDNEKGRSKDVKDVKGEKHERSKDTDKYEVSASREIEGKFKKRDATSEMNSRSKIYSTQDDEEKPRRKESKDKHALDERDKSKSGSSYNAVRDSKGKYYDTPDSSSFEEDKQEISDRKRVSDDKRRKKDRHEETASGSRANRTEDNRRRTRKRVSKSSFSESDASDEHSYRQHRRDGKDKIRQKERELVGRDVKKSRRKTSPSKNETQRRRKRSYSRDSSSEIEEKRYQSMREYKEKGKKYDEEADKESSRRKNRNDHRDDRFGKEEKRKSDKQRLDDHDVEDRDSSRKRVVEKSEEIENDASKKRRLKVFARRNDEESILNARERYLARKKAAIVPVTYDDDSDN